MRSLLVLLLVFTACKGERTAEIEQVTKETLSAVRAREVLKVQVRLEKTEPPTREELDVRRRIEDRLQQENVGTLMNSTTDIGHYDLTLEVESTNDAIPRVRTILRDEGVLERATVSVQGNK